MDFGFSFWSQKVNYTYCEFVTEVWKKKNAERIKNSNDAKSRYDWLLNPDGVTK